MKMRMYADKNGIKQHLNPTDNTLFKTLNNNGLKIWEETEDYWIYMDKDVVTTTVQQYVTGAFDRYLEMNRTIDSNISLLKSYNIEWTTEDKCRLFESINDSMLNELASQASDLGIEDSQPLVLEPKTVPIEYLCCFIVDKETKEFYVEEGYENLTNFSTIPENVSHFKIDIINQLYEGVLNEQEKQNELSKLDTISFEKPLDIVKAGLICWLDARDGSGTQTEWVDRSGNSNNATLTNFNFDENSGWTGKGLKLDGVDDWVYVSKNEMFQDMTTGKTIEICFMKKKHNILKPIQKE